MIYDYRELNEPEPAALLPQDIGASPCSPGPWACGWPPTCWPDTGSSSARGCRQRHPDPIDDQAGIPAQAYEEMLAAFSPQALLDFYHSMLLTSPGWTRFSPTGPGGRPRKSGRSLARCAHLICAPAPPAADIIPGHLCRQQGPGLCRPRPDPRLGQGAVPNRSEPHFPFYDLGWDDLLKQGE